MSEIEKVTAVFVSAKDPSTTYKVKASPKALDDKAALVTVSTKTNNIKPKSPSKHDYLYIERDENDSEMSLYTSNGPVIGRLSDNDDEGASDKAAIQGIYHLVESPVKTLTDETKLTYRPVGGEAAEEVNADAAASEGKENAAGNGTTKTTTSSSTKVTVKNPIKGKNTTSSSSSSSSATATTSEDEEAEAEEEDVVNAPKQQPKGGSGSSELLDVRIKGQNKIGAGSSSTYTLARDKVDGTIVMVPISTGIDDSRYEKGYLRVTKVGEMTKDELKKLMTRAIAKATNRCSNAWVTAGLVILGVVLLVLLIFIIVFALQRDRGGSSST